MAYEGCSYFTIQPCATPAMKHISLEWTINQNKIDNTDTKRTKTYIFKQQFIKRCKTKKTSKITIVKKGEWSQVLQSDTANSPV